MLKKWKRIIVAVLSSAMIITSAGCTAGKGTAYALTVDGYKVNSGIYIYYSYSALAEAKNLAAKQDEKLDTNDEKALKKVKIEGKDFLDYVKDKTTENCINHVAIIRHFEELGLEFTDEELDEIDAYADSSWESSEDMFTSNGIGKDSLKEIASSSYMSEAIFNAYYGEDGSENVTQQQLKDYYVENNARVRYIDMDLHDSEGNELDEAGKKEIKTMADDFLKRAKAIDDELEMLAEFDKFQTEYDDYVLAQAGEESDTEPTTEAETEAPTEEETEANVDEDADADTDADEDTDKDEDTDEDEDAVTYTDEDEDSEYDAAVTTAPEDEESVETTTTVSPYANENIIAVVTTTEGTAEEDVTYSPSKQVYDWIFNDAKMGVPEIIEDDQTMYVIVRYGIEERMTEEDLWTETSVENVRYTMFSDELQDMLDSWGNEYEVVKNDRAYKRYDPFNVTAE